MSPQTGRRSRVELGIVQRQDAEPPAPKRREYQTLGKSNQPLVSVVIASRARPDHLGRTLRELNRQSYAGGVEMIVLDDESPESLELVVRELWPSARFIRKEQNVGQCACRTEG